MVNYTPNLQVATPELDEQARICAGDILLKSALTLTKEMSISDACSLIDKHKASGAPVVDSAGRLLGFLSQKDCLKYILDMKYYNGGPKRVEDFMSKTVMTVHKEETILYLAELFLKNNYQMYPVVDTEGFLLGVVTRSELFSRINKLSQTTW
ncbi:CBS domain-containing protein [Bacteriovorax sp. Seq25_V]|uniref:CBS domain-containing protein n=1 Tax=Bacteriovorax sp. Seq25_V TaxID=1201288 RepID=UPI000389F3DF|nr:CBS domain-containing protein [Bacteriovorax sp. Seq25_V]EQC43925.1 CBS domain protein [Bacteriovorax sp. Seq25_V]